MSIPAPVIDKGASLLMKQPFTVVLLVVIGSLFGYFIFVDRISPKEQIAAMQARIDKLEAKNEALLIRRDDEIMKELQSATADRETIKQLFNADRPHIRQQ